MIRYQTVAVNDFDSPEYPLVEVSQAKTDIDYWISKVERWRIGDTPIAITCSTRMSEPSADWNRPQYIRFFDSRDRLRVRSISSFSDSEETGVLSDSKGSKTPSSTMFSLRDHGESGYITASTRLRTTQVMQAAFEIAALFESFSYDVFEDGVESEFVDELQFLVFEYGKMAINAIANTILKKAAEPQILSEALRWLGQIDHSMTHESRLMLLEKCLSNPSRWIRDGAALGIASMKDTRAIPYLIDAIRNEQIPDLRDDFKIILDSLQRYHTHAILSATNHQA